MNAVQAADELRGRGQPEELCMPFLLDGDGRLRKGNPETRAGLERRSVWRRVLDSREALDSACSGPLSKRGGAFPLVLGLLPAAIGGQAGVRASRKLNGPSAPSA